LSQVVDRADIAAEIDADFQPPPVATIETDCVDALVLDGDALIVVWIEFAKKLVGVFEIEAEVTVGQTAGRVLFDDEKPTGIRRLEKLAASGKTYVYQCDKDNVGVGNASAGHGVGVRFEARLGQDFEGRLATWTYGVWRKMSLRSVKSNSAGLAPMGPELGAKIIEPPVIQLGGLTCCRRFLASRFPRFSYFCCVVAAWRGIGFHRLGFRRVGRGKRW